MPAVYLTGEITRGDYQRYLSAVDLTGARLVVLDSLGGLIGEALQIAEHVQENRMHTYVGGGAQCHSACMIVFLAGHRKYVERGAQLGLHLASDDLGDVSVSGTAVMSAFLGRLGVPLDIIRKMSQVGPLDIWLLADADQKRLRIEILDRSGAPERVEAGGREDALKHLREALRVPAHPEPERAIFYEQGEENSSGRASQGAVSWERLHRPGEFPAVEARIDLPEQNAAVTITFASNGDPNLPASHLIEIDFGGETSLGGRIQRVLALVLKPSEQARGEALAGAALPITDRLFWIALSNDPEQIKRNLSLLRDGSWFDMPIIYESGERALLTFDKGSTGRSVLEELLSD